MVAIKAFFGYDRFVSVTGMLFDLELPIVMILLSVIANVLLLCSVKQPTIYNSSFYLFRVIVIFSSLLFYGPCCLTQI